MNPAMEVKLRRDIAAVGRAAAARWPRCWLKDWLPIRPARTVAGEYLGCGRAVGGLESGALYASCMPVIGLVGSPAPVG